MSQKSRTLVIRKGKSIDEQPFEVGEEIIPSIQKEPLKTLGRIYNSSVTDTIARKDLRKKIVDFVQKLDKSLLTGIMKVWAYQNLLLAMIGWPLMIHEIPLSRVEAVEIYLNSYLRKWLGVSKNMSSVSLYCNETPCPLPMHGIVTEFKKRKVGGLLQLRQSKDQSVRANVPQLYSGKRWKVADEVDRIESRLNVAKVMGSTQTGRTGFGFQKERKRYKTEEQKSLRESSHVIKKAESETLYMKAVQQSVQGQWLRWQSYIKRDMSWHNLLKSALQLVSFFLGSTFNTLASPQNRVRWGLEDGLECGLCGKEKASVSHILAGCQKALQRGRYTYRRNAVLRVTAHEIQVFINKVKKEEQKVAKDRIRNCVKEGEQCKRSTKKVDKLGILHEAKDWVMETDLDQQLLFPEIICSSTQRPDIVIYLAKLKKVVVVELTCPAKENIEERHSEKLGCYEILTKDCISTGWKVHLFAIEVGVRGYAACSLRTCFSKLGFTHRSVRGIIKKASDSALRCSFWIWLKREDDEWNHNQRRKQVSKNRQNNECTNREKDPMKSVEIQKKRNQSSARASCSKAWDEPVKRVDSIPHRFEGRMATRTETVSSQKTRVHQRENVNKLRINKQCSEGSRKPEAGSF